MKQSLNGKWRLISLDEPDKLSVLTSVPGSFYSALLEHGMMDDPYYRLNEYKSTDLCLESTCWEREFSIDEKLWACERLLLKFYGIDTISTVLLNGKILGTTDNMHREYVFDITDVALESGNTLEVKISSPLKYVKEKQDEYALWGVVSTVPGFPHIRKAHYMYGWDWGPKLPDMGIWRDVELVGVENGIIDGVYVTQDHSEIGKGIVKLNISADLKYIISDGLKLEARLTSPDGNVITASASIAKVSEKTKLSLEVQNAMLWYPNGYGDHPLYSLEIAITDNHADKDFDTYKTNVGLRTLTLCRDKMDDGEDFAFVVNGIKIFAMGANYIPEDQIIPRCSDQRSEELIKSCVDANFNMLRVWGGGYYPSDGFYDICDRMGILVWQDFMFACAVYKATDEFMATIRQEATDNVKRLRNHPSLALWCGNNEIESMWEGWDIDADPALKKDYLELFEELIPSVLAEYDPVTPYWPSSPSSGGGFEFTGNLSKGDAHYWAVWHGFRPFTDYFKYKFRFCSEYGFESLPSIKTVRAFAEESDLELTSEVMEAHQKCSDGTNKVLYYLNEMSHPPKDFEGLIYATQMVQSDAIRLNVEHMRQHRDVCRGSLYWQVNDSNPVISWASIDYFNRCKPLHYAAKRFYADVLLSCNYENPDELWLNVSSERLEAFDGEISWKARLNTGEIISSGSGKCNVDALSSKDVLPIIPEASGISEDIKNKAFLEFELKENGKVISSGIYMFASAKDFIFTDPKLKTEISETSDSFIITISAEAFAKGVFLELANADCVFSDNYIDICGASRTIEAKKTGDLSNMTMEEFKAELSLKSYYEALKLSEN